MLFSYRNKGLNSPWTMLTSMRVAIIGQGYVGLTISVGAFGAGHQVFGIESNEKLVTKLNAGLSHIEGISAEKVKVGICIW